MRVTGPAFRRADALWLLALCTASLGVAWLAHRHLGLSLQPQGWVHWVAFLLLGPWVEEWALRAQLLPECTRVLSRWWPRIAPAMANGGVSLIFVALHHGMAGSMAWLWFIPSWVLGMVWFRFQRLSVCALVHTWFNVSLLAITAVGSAHAGEPARPSVSLLTRGAAMSDCAKSHEPPGTTARSVVSARLHEPTWHRQADVWATDDPTGKPGTWALVVRVQPQGATHAVRCWRTSTLLGPPDTSPVPALAFEQGLLVVTWQRHETTGAQAHPGGSAVREMHRMVFDTDQPQAPLVRYQHQVTTLLEVRGVNADLVGHEAEWLRRPAHSPEGTRVVGRLQPLALVGLQDMPDHTHYSLQPQVNRVHGPPAR